MVTAYRINNSCTSNRISKDVKSQTHPLWGTQWILHYYLATRRAECSDAWYILINRYLPTSLDFTSDQFQSYFTSTMANSVKNQLALSKDPLAALSTYTRLDALARLHILEKQNKIYTVRQPYLPPVLVIGYM